MNKAGTFVRLKRKAMAIIQRNYNHKDVDMLVTSSTIVETAIANKTFLQTKRSTWKDPFFSDLQTKIETAIKEHLGVDSAKELREATIIVNGMQKQAMTDLAESKVQIMEDFKSNKVRRAEILNQLGFTPYLKEVQKGSHEAMINLLYQFKTNLSTTLKTEIVTAGTAETLLTGIVGYADDLKDANVTQETYKGSRKSITAAGVKAFNEIYDSAISICKIAAKFYKDQQDMKDQFSYRIVAAKLSPKPKPKPPPPPVTPV